MTTFALGEIITVNGVAVTIDDLPAHLDQSQSDCKSARIECGDRGTVIPPDAGGVSDVLRAHTWAGLAFLLIPPDPDASWRAMSQFAHAFLGSWPSPAEFVAEALVAGAEPWGDLGDAAEEVSAQLEQSMTFVQHAGHVMVFQ